MGVALVLSNVLRRAVLGPVGAAPPQVRKELDSAP